MLGGNTLMKTFFRVSVLGILMLAVVAASSQITFAQDDDNDPKAELYAKFVDNYASDKIEEREIAVAAGKEFIKKYENSPDDKPIVDYLKGAIPTIEKGIADQKIAIKAFNDEKDRINKRNARLGAFDKAHKSGDVEATFAAGADLLKYEPKLVDVTIYLACTAYQQSFEKKDGFEKYNDRAIKYARESISLLEANTPTEFGSYGGYNCAFKTEQLPDGRNNALGWMNYYIGFVKYFREKQTDEAVPYFFKATQFNSGAKEFPQTYRSIGSWYVAKTTEITGKRIAVTTELNEAVKAPTPDEELIKTLNARIDDMMALERGYADRAIDAYSRAYSLVTPAEKTAEYGKAIFSTLQELYKFRYTTQPEMQSDSKINMNVSMIKSTTMPDPTSTVQPVLDGKTDGPEPATTPDASKTTGGASRTRTVTSN